jgi:DNA-binding NtrC family response regulator
MRRSLGIPTVPTIKDSAPGATYVLYVVCGRTGGGVTLPREGVVVLGRDEGVDLYLSDPTVSRRHARITGGDPPNIEDLGSTNGTAVMKRPLRQGERAALCDGTLIELGDLKALVQRSGHAPSEAAPPSAGRPIAPRDPQMMALYEIADRVARGSLSALVLGETGVGKDVLASYIHTHSARARQTFLRLNCAALPPSLLEGELFGYERGAFTGADRAKAGLFESAHGGTVFLDEIGELPITLQAKLLHLLEAGEVTRLGSLAPRRVDVRVLSATNRDLQALMAEGAFRSDLYFRLAGVTVHIPPLRERPLDRDALADHFLACAAAALGRPQRVLSDAARRAIVAYPWPGNVREMRNTLERGVLLADGDVIEPEHLCLAPLGAPPEAVAEEPPPRTITPLAFPVAPGGVTQEVAVDSPDAPPASAPAPSAPGRTGFYEERSRQEQRAILEALETCGGNQTRAAALLGMPRRTFVKRLSEYGVDGPRKARRTVPPRA